MKYDYLIVGAGLFGSTVAHQLKQKNAKCLVIDKRSHIGGNIYCEKVQNINVHKYGAHIFHTSNKATWEFVNQFAEFNNYINSPIAIYKNELYNLPFNMNTFSKMWNIKTPQEAKEIINRQKIESNITNPQNLEEQAISLVGVDIYQKLVKGYTEKQWGRECKNLPAFIINRLPLRFTYNNNYFNDLYQGIPIGGYNKIIEKMLQDVDVQLNISYQEFADTTEDTFDKVIYTGCIDQYFDYKLGNLQYRSVRFENEILQIDNYQGNAVVNYTERDVPFTRIIEHKHFEFTKSDITVISKEYPTEWHLGEEPYYPINDDKNATLYKQYLDLARAEKNVIFGGRLGLYKYLDMDKTIEHALQLAKQLEK